MLYIFKPAVLSTSMEKNNPSGGLLPQERSNNSEGLVTGSHNTQILVCSYLFRIFAGGLEITFS